MTEIVKQLGFSHPGVIKITEKIIDRGYLKSKTDKLD